jgi:hypothetical protein
LSSQSCIIEAKKCHTYDGHFWEFATENCCAGIENRECDFVHETPFSFALVSLTEFKGLGTVTITYPPTNATIFVMRGSRAAVQPSGRPQRIG